MKVTVIHMKNGNHFYVEEQWHRVRNLVRIAWPTSLKKLTRWPTGGSIWVKTWDIEFFEEVEV